MTKPISKSKRQLAQLLIEAGVTQFPKGANWAAQDRDGSKYPSEPLTVMFYNVIPTKPKKGVGYWFGECGTTDIVGKGVRLPTLIPNWHQTVLSRDEFDQIVAETAVQSETVWSGVDMSKDGDDTATMTVEPTTTPTLDQLLQNWRNADDYAQRKQTEADEAAAMRDERWQAVQTRAGEMGVTVGRCDPAVVDEPVKPVITGKFRNAKLGSPKHYITGKGWSDEVCDECGKRFGDHYDVRCNI